MSHTFVHARHEVRALPSVSHPSTPALHSRLEPLQPQVLLARVNAVVRRIHRPPVQPQTEQHGQYRLDPGAQTASWGGHVEALTPKEFQLASLLFNNLSRPLSREYLLRRIWGQRPDLETRTLDAHVSRLRAKLHEIDPEANIIQTEWGIGYRFVEG